MFCEQILGVNISENEYQKYAIEFSEALDRLNFLVNNQEKDSSGQISIRSKEADVICKHMEEIKFINKMRNMTAHRGKRFLRYTVLDRIMIENIFPFLKELLQCQELNYYNECFSRVYKITDVIDEILSASNKGDYDYSIIAFYKEKARCSPNKKISFGKLPISDQIRIQNKKEILGYAGAAYTSDNLYKCPCCEKEALIELIDVIDTEEVDVDIPEEEIYQTQSVPIYGRVGYSCGYCDFTVNGFINFDFKEFSEKSTDKSSRRIL